MKPRMRKMFQDLALSKIGLIRAADMGQQKRARYGGWQALATLPPLLDGEEIATPKPKDVCPQEIMHLGLSITSIECASPHQVCRTPSCPQVRG